MCTAEINRVGKMVLWSYLLGCAGPALTAACAMTYKDPFLLPMNPDQRRDAKSAKIALAQVNEWVDEGVDDDGCMMHDHA